MSRPLTSVVAIVGPTAVGKTAVAIELAWQLDGEIVSADARQVFRYMDVGTAKPSLEQQAAVRHYMLDVVQPSEPYSAQRYTEEASRVLALLRARSKAALVVGGTGFYLRNLLDGVQLPPVKPDPALRSRLRERARKHGPASLHEELSLRDPASSARIHPNNLTRIIRALEVVEVLGGPVPPAASGGSTQARYVGLTLPRTELGRRADCRAVQQMKDGMLEEAAALLEMGYDPELPALQGFGYRHMVECVQGKISRDEALLGYQQATRQYIRRQLTWFRSDSRITWIDVSHLAPDEVAAAIAVRLADGQ